jgi:hypothetical protein
MKNVVAFALLSLLVACGGGSDGQLTVVDASPGGIWKGMDPISGLALVGLVDEAGNFHFLRGDGVQYVGKASVSGNDLSASFDGYAPFGSVFSDNSTHGTGTLSGTVHERSSMSGDVDFKTDANSSSSGTLALTFDSLYTSGSSLAAIAGNYTDPTSGTTVSVTGAGDISSQDAATGCVINGTVSIINAAYDAYSISYSYGNCTGAAMALNGVQFTGLGALNTTVNPAQVIIGVTGKSGTISYAFVLLLNHQ